MLGPTEILMLIFLGGGGLSTDLVSGLDAPAYFQARNITVTTDKLVELATRDPVDGKTQIAQLLALRTLAEEAAKVKKAKNYAAILTKIEEVADGKKAQDPQGFAAEYARMAAAALGSKQFEAPVFKLPENSARQDAFIWFPDSVKIVAAMDFRSGQALSPGAGKAMRKIMFGGMLFPAQAMAQFTNVAEKLGNVRADRIAIAFTPDPQNPGKGRIYMRLTGKGDAKRLVALLKETNPGVVTKEIKGFRGQRVTTVQLPRNTEPGFAVVGDSDFIIAGYDGGPQANPMAALEQVLAVRAGKEKNVLAGPLAASLKKLSPRASAVAAGELPEEMRRELMRPPGFTVFPTHVRAEMVRGKRGATVRWEGKLKDADEAKAFVADVDRLRKMGIEGIKEVKQKKLPPGLPLPPKTFEVLTKVLESVKAEAKGAEAHGSVTLPEEAMKVMTSLGVFGAMAAPAAPPQRIPPPKVEEKPLKKGASLRVPARDLAPAWLLPAPVLTRPGPAITCLHEHADRG